jgi:signal transduction histidine kinase/streptogramin lyase
VGDLKGLLQQGYWSMWLANQFAFLLLAVAVLGQIATDSRVFALEGRYAVRNIRHTSWTSEKGVSAVFEIQQDSNGYLWLNTANGVVRFDGVRFQSVEEATNNALLSSDIRAAYIAPSGRIWFTTRTAGLVLLENGHAGVYSSDRRCISVAENGGMAEDPDGSLWIKALSGLYHVRGFSCEQITQAGGYPGGLPAAILVDHQGTVWVKAASGALVFRRKNESKFELSQYVSPPTSKAAFLHEGPDSSIWLSDENGLRRLDVRAAQKPPTRVPVLAGDIVPRFGDFAFGLDGSLWAVIDKRICRFDDGKWLSKGTVDAGHAESTGRVERLSSNAIWSIKVDHEGSLWVGTNSGLDRLRVTAPKTILLRPTEEREFSLAAGDNGSVWTGNTSLPLTRVNPDGHFVRFDGSHNAICIRRDYKGTTWSAAEGPNQLWHASTKGFLPVHYPEEKMARIVSLAVDRNNEPWINIRSGTTFHFANGTWRNENEAIGKDIGILGAMVNDSDGMVWIAFTNQGGGHSGTRGQLVRWDGTAYQKYFFTDRRFDISVGTMAVRGDHVWLGGTGGIVLFTRGNFYLMQFIDSKLPGRVSGIVETEMGELWANGFTGVTHVSAAELSRWIQNPTSKVDGEHLDAFDGLPGLSAERFPEPSLVEASDGRIWFATMKGIAWLDENTFARTRNSIPPPVFVTSIVANGKAYSGTSSVALPKHTQNLEIDYTALSLAVPERVRFRYRLDGVDKDWQEPGARRQAFYTNLSPGRYAFHVTACNNDGVWNNDGASLQFSVAPAFYQTNWFLMFCGAALLALMLAVSQWRLRQAAARAQLQMEERIAERARIARELHDTLLQSFQGLILKFQRARNLLPTRPEKAMESLDIALEKVEHAIIEGRDAIHCIRTFTPINRDLVGEITALGEELAVTDGRSSLPTLRVVVEGSPKIVRPLFRNEILQIVREALRNAHAHANARNIEAEIRYEEKMLRVRIRDDGVGINHEHLGEAGRAGHYGLRGMRERAAQIGARLDVWSEQGGGTEVALRVPDRVAYKAG